MAGVAGLRWLGIVLVALNRFMAPVQCGEPMMPAVFILGDSLVDVGNNNYILTLAKSNFPPNGLDFPEGPTGRFCNGRTTSDFLGSLHQLFPFFACNMDNLVCDFTKYLLLLTVYIQGPFFFTSTRTLLKQHPE